MTRRSEKLMVVDDNPVVLLNTAEMLRAAGFEVIEAQTGQEGWRLTRENFPDLILLDVMLPDISGFELCRRIKADSELKSVFVVLLSALETTSGSKVTGLDAGADGYVARPIENRELLAQVQSLLRIQQAETALRQARDELEQRVRERTLELAEANARLRQMSARLVEVQEAERRSVARELHDEMGQILTGLRLLVDQALPLAAAPASGRLNEASGLINLLIHRVRSLSLELRPPVLDDLGLLVALDWHFKRFTEQTSIRVNFRHSPIPTRLPPPVETAVFRVVQESLTNIARHAQVSEAAVRLWRDEENVRLQVEDLGVGFDAAAALTACRTSGLSGIKERVELLGGEFTLESVPGKGTLLTVELPLTVGGSASLNVTGQ